MVGVAGETRTLARRGRGQVLLAAISFTTCFAAWGLVPAFAPRFRAIFALSDFETAMVVATPVLLGSLARIPAGMLTDRFGGRRVFAALMLAVAVPLWTVPTATGLGWLLALGFLAGLAGSSFAIGVGHVSRWTPAERQGTALGLYGLGTGGQSAAVFLGPAVAGIVGWEQVFRGTAALLALWGLSFAVLARDPPAAARPATLRAMLEVLRRERLAWILGSFYFLTFGGFVAFSLYLPTLLVDQFGLGLTDAGFRAAGFVVVATLLRPVGGWLADRIGGARVLTGVFLGVAPFAFLLTWPSLLPFSVGALGCAALLGLGNGAVFQLVPRYFPGQVGTVAGVVGAIGGLGGFVPPLLLGAFRESVGAFWPGFVLLAATALVLWRVNARVLMPREEPGELAGWTREVDQLRAGAWATLVSGLLVAAILVGSRNLQNFDPALVVYTFGTVFATWGVAYHYRVWLLKPPTWRLWQRSWEVLGRPGFLRRAARLISVAFTHLAAQTFIFRRSPLRGWTHLFLSWGCTLAALVTFPLVFGWIHFTTSPDDPLIYVPHLFGFEVGSFRLGTLYAGVIFHVLDIAAMLVLAGIALALRRRLREAGPRALQVFSRDLLPLVLLFAVSATGIALTASAEWLAGAGYSFLSMLHAVTVVGTLLFLPFGKFFHVFQRPAQLGVKLVLEEGERDEGARCPRCGDRFASRMQIEDLAAILPPLGFDYRLPGSHWQAFCPPCRRRSLGRAQMRTHD